MPTHAACLKLLSTMVSDIMLYSAASWSLISGFTLTRGPGHTLARLDWNVVDTDRSVFSDWMSTGCLHKTLCSKLVLLTLATQGKSRTLPVPQKLPRIVALLFLLPVPKFPEFGYHSWDSAHDKCVTGVNCSILCTGIPMNQSHLAKSTKIYIIILHGVA